MQVHYYPNDLPNLEGCVLTIGTFDGVHLGHRSILQHLTTNAAAAKRKSVLITFNPHPRQVIFADPLAIKLLNTQEEKLWLLKQCGIDEVVIVPFTSEFASLPADEYLKSFLVKNFSPSLIVVGYDHRFGSKRSGNLDMLQQHGKLHGFMVNEIPAHLIDASAISSTRIRNALKTGNVKEANEALGYTYSIAGIVMHGKQLGRTIGYPTANAGNVDEHKMLPANGVYAVRVKVGDKPHLYNAMLNIGNRPTVDGTSQSIESHLFDFNESFYDSPIRIYFVERLRDEKKFSGLDALKEQLSADEIQARKVLNESSANYPMIPV